MEMNENLNISQPGTKIDNKYFAFIKRNRYTIFAFTMLLILLSIIGSLLVLSSKNTSDQNKQISPTYIPTQVPKPTQQPTMILPTIQPTAFLTLQEKALIETQTRPQINKLVAVNYSVSAIKSYGEEWAIMQISSPETDQAHVVIKKENGLWNIKLGPGTFLDESSLQAIGAPRSLIDEANNAL